MSGAPMLRVQLYFEYYYRFNSGYFTDSSLLSLSRSGDITYLEKEKSQTSTFVEVAFFVDSNFSLNISGQLGSPQAVVESPKMTIRVVFVGFYW